jgi:hypothetical protein
MSETIAAAARQIQNRWPDPERRQRHRQASERQLQLLAALGLLHPALAPAVAGQRSGALTGNAVR